MITVTGAQVIGTIAGVIGIDIMYMAKDPYIEYKKKGMTPGQQDIFKQLIEERKQGEGRGGADNLLKKIIDEIAKFVKETFPNK